MITCYVTINDRIELLSKFIKYYKSLDVDGITLIVNGWTKNPLWEQIEAIAKDEWLVAGHELGLSPEGVPDNDKMNTVRSGERYSWSVICDLDEFHYFNRIPIREVIATMEDFGADIAVTKMVDRIAANHNFPAITDERLDDTFPLVCNLTEAIGANSNKVAIVRKGIDTGPGHHYAPGKALSCGFETHHFKWTAGVVERTRQRMQAWLDLPSRPPEFSEYREFLTFVENGKLVVPADKTLDIRPATRINI